MRIRAKWGLRVLTASLLTVGTAVITSSPSEAASVSPVCDAFVLDANGVPAAAPAATGQALPALEISNLGAGLGPFEVGTAFDLTAPETAGPPLPTQTTVEVNGTPISATVMEIKNIKATIAIAGGATLGTPTLSGGNVLSAAVQLQGTDSIVLSLPGSQGGSSFGVTGDAFFPAGSSYTIPAITVPVTAPGSPTTLTTSLTALTLDTQVHLGNPAAPIRVRLNCTAPANTLGSIEIIAEPAAAAGAPDAKNDSLTTNKDTPVTIAVLTNDVADPGGRPIDNASLVIAQAPTKGTAVVNADGTITYTPNAGTTGTDSFRYTICSTDDAELGDGPCDTATVSVSVTDTAAAATTTTTVAATTTTTVAAAAAAAPNQLPRTGPASRLFVTLGLVTLLLGSAGLVLAPRRKTPRWLDD